MEINGNVTATPAHGNTSTSVPCFKDMRINGMGVHEGARPARGVACDGLGAGWALWRRRRFVLAALAFLGLISLYSTRVTFSVAIVAMTSGTGAHARFGNASSTDASFANASADGFSIDAYLVNDSLVNSSVNVTFNDSLEATEGDVANASAGAGGEFDWDSRTQGLLLSGFFYGYAASQLPAGWLVARAGGANLMGAGILGAALLSLLAPTAARFGGAWLLLAVRIAQGVLQGCVFPGAAQLLARWAPPMERSRIYAAIVSGINVGNVVTLPVSGLLATHWGWPSAFYATGALGVMWWLLWQMQIADSPEVDKRASLTERDFIKDKLGTVTVCSKVISHPWRAIFTSPPYLAKIAATFCADWAFYTVQTQIPMYLKDTLGYNLRSAGFVSALPFVAMGCFQLVAGYLADLLEGKKLLQTTNVRKLFVCGGFMMLVLCLLLSTYLTDATSIVACIAMGTAFVAFVYTASSVNILDLAPLHASVLSGLSSTIANLSGMLTPQLTGFIVRTQSVEEWRIVFYVTSGMCLLGAAIYGVFGSGELQPWAEDGLEPPVGVALVAVKTRPHEDGGVDNPAATVS